MVFSTFAGRRKIQLISIVFATFAFSAPMVLAQVMQPDDIVGKIAASQAGPTVTMLKSQNALAFAPNQQIPGVFDFPVIDISVEFQDGSHMLTTNGMMALRSVAAALQDPRIEADRFQVGGVVVSESDPVGAVRLSSKRAQVVVEHLNTFYDIAPDRLFAVGYGSANPIDPNFPTAATNTRIRLTNLLLD